MDPRKVDPAAMLVAVFAVALGPLHEEGPWEPINSVTCGVVVLVLMLFAWPTRRPAKAPLVATSIVVSFVAGIGLAWPFQEWWLARGPRLTTPDIVVDATWMGLGWGLVAGAAYGLALWLRPVDPDVAEAEAQRKQERVRRQRARTAARAGSGPEEA